MQCQQQLLRVLLRLELFLVRVHLLLRRRWLLALLLLVVAAVVDTTNLVVLVADGVLPVFQR